MSDKITHNLNESYLQSLTEEERIRQMQEWTIEEQRQYFCPNGTISLDEAMEYLKNKTLQLIHERYGDI